MRLIAILAAALGVASKDVPRGAAMDLLVVPEEVDYRVAYVRTDEQTCLVIPVVPERANQTSAPSSDVRLLPEIKPPED